MDEVATALKALRLYGMAAAWADLTAQGRVGIDAARWLIEHLLQAEHTDRALRSVSYPPKSARFPVHRDLAGFDFSQAKVDEHLIRELADLSFTEVAHNVLFIGGTGTGKTHLATALGVSGLTQHGRRVRFFSTVDLVNSLEQEKAQGRAGKLALSLMRVDLVSLDERGYLPFSQAGGTWLFHLLSKRYEHTRVMITPNLTFAEWANIFTDAKMTTALLDRLTHHGHSVETGNDSYRFRHSNAIANPGSKPGSRPGEKGHPRRPSVRNTVTLVHSHSRRGATCFPGQYPTSTPGQDSTGINSLGELCLPADRHRGEVLPRQ